MWGGVNQTPFLTFFNQNQNHNRLFYIAKSDFTTLKNSITFQDVEDTSFFNNSM